MRFGDINIAFLGHSGFLITTEKGKKVAIDPYDVASTTNKVDMILITHSHRDHCHLPSIQALARADTTVITTADSQSNITKLESADMQVIEVGDELDFGDIKVEAVPAYNLDKPYHPKKEGWVGFVLKMGSNIVYHAGDTDNIPEIQKLTGYSKHDNNFVALLPVSGKTVMTAEEAAQAASMLRPDLAIPMHYGSVLGTIDDANRFVKICSENGINAEVFEKI